MGPELSKVGDVADVVAFARLLDVPPRDLVPGKLLDSSHRLKNRNAVAAPATEIIDLAGTRLARKLLDGTDDVETVDVVAHLFAFVAEYRIGSTLERCFDQICQETVKLDAGVRRSAQTPAPKNAHIHPEVE